MCAAKSTLNLTMKNSSSSVSNNNSGRVFAFPVGGGGDWGRILVQKAFVKLNNERTNDREWNIRFWLFLSRPS